MADPSPPAQMVVVGRVAGLFGVQGWVKVYAYTRHREDILEYDRWFLQQGDRWVPNRLQEGRTQGQGIVAKLAGIDGRDTAAPWVGADIAVAASDLPPLKADEYYWSQLEGLEVVNLEGTVLGRVSHLFETGANDVLVVVGERERLIPYIPDAIKEVDLSARRIRVDWDADF